MAKFNVGDKVVRVSPVDETNSPFMKTGEVYTVTSCGINCLNVAEDNGLCGDWYVDGFVLDKPSEPGYPNYSLHELLDRISLCQKVIDDHIANHSLGHLVAKDIMLAQGHLYNAYDKIAKLHITKA